MRTTKIPKKVMFVEDFRNQWLEAAADDEGLSMKMTIEYYDGQRLRDLGERISGKEGVVIETTYNGVDRKEYFEEVDGDFVIFRSLFSFV